MSAETINGARIVLETLHRLGVTDMFGYPGGAVIPIYDEIYSFPEIKHYFVRHEQGAAHAADGYARVSGRVGVCLATSGPGATNLVTGLATAYYDSVPLVCFTGQVSRHLIGNDAFQEVDVIGITQPITKWAYQIRKPEVYVNLDCIQQGLGNASCGPLPLDEYMIPVNQPLSYSFRLEMIK